MFLKYKLEYYFFWRTIGILFYLLPICINKCFKNINWNTILLTTYLKPRENIIIYYHYYILD